MHQMRGGYGRLFYFSKTAYLFQIAIALELHPEMQSV